jgi:hypothetical protein
LSGYLETLFSKRYFVLELQRGKTPQGLQTPPSTREEDRIGKATSLIVEEEEEEGEEAGPSASIYTGQDPSPSEMLEKPKQDLLEKHAAATQEEVEVVEEVEVEEVEEVEENVPGHANIQRGQPEIEIISHPSPGKKTVNRAYLLYLRLQLVYNMLKQTGAETPTTNKISRKSISVTVSGNLPTPGPSNSGAHFFLSTLRCPVFFLNYYLAC